MTVSKQFSIRSGALKKKKGPNLLLFNSITIHIDEHMSILWVTMPCLFYGYRYLSKETWVIRRTNKTGSSLPAQLQILAWYKPRIKRMEYSPFFDILIGIWFWAQIYSRGHCLCSPYVLSDCGTNLYPCRHFIVILLRILNIHKMC